MPDLSQDECLELYAEYNNAEIELGAWRAQLSDAEMDGHSITSDEDYLLIEDNIAYWEDRAIAACDAYQNGNCADPSI